MEAAGADALKRLLALTRMFFRRIKREKEESLVMLACRGVAPWHSEMLQLTRKLWREYRVWIEEMFAEAAADRNLEIDARKAALTFAQLSDGLWMGWLLDPEAYSLEEAEAAVRDWLLDYLEERQGASITS